MTKYEIMFELRTSTSSSAALRPVIIEATDVHLSSDWVEFSTGGNGNLHKTIAAFPRDKIFGFREAAETDQ